MSKKLYVYTPGFPRRQGHSKLLNMLVLGEFPQYKMVVSKDAVHMVHKQYRQYIIKVNYKYSSAYDLKIIYNKIEANEYVRLCVAKYPNSLIEYVAIDWNKKLVNYGWHKHFYYSKAAISIPILDSLDKVEHPLEAYLFDEYNTYVRLDDDVGIEWKITGGINGEEDETNDYNVSMSEDIAKMLEQFS